MKIIIPRDISYEDKGEKMKLLLLLLLASCTTNNYYYLEPQEEKLTFAPNNKVIEESNKMQRLHFLQTDGPIATHCDPPPLTRDLLYRPCPEPLTNGVR